MVSVPEYAVAAPAAANHEHNYKNLNLYNGEWVKVSVPDRRRRRSRKGWARFSPYC